LKETGKYFLIPFGTDFRHILTNRKLLGKCTFKAAFTIATALPLCCSCGSVAAWTMQYLVFTTAVQLRSGCSATAARNDRFHFFVPTRTMLQSAAANDNT